MNDEDIHEIGEILEGFLSHNEERFLLTNKSVSVLANGILAQLRKTPEEGRAAFLRTLSGRAKQARILALDRARAERPFRLPTFALRPIVTEKISTVVLHFCENFPEYR